MAEKFVLIPQRELQKNTPAGNNSTIKAPPPGIPVNDHDLMKTMEVVSQGPARLQSDNLGYVNTERLGENNESEVEDEGTWTSMWQRV